MTIACRPKLFFIPLTLTIVLIFAYNSYQEKEFGAESHQPAVIDDADEVAQPSPDNTKIIVDWTGFIDGGFGAFFDHNCAAPYKCVVTNNRLIATKANSVIFHGANIDWNDLPSTRRAYQRYVFALWESPVYTKGDLSRGAAFFNWTMTYRSDSDFAAPYGVFEQSDEAPLARTLPEAAKKNRTAAWFVSNCATDSRRENLVKRLAEAGVDIDVYTNSKLCEKMFAGVKNVDVLRCGSKDVHEGDVDCVRRLDDYFFYLAFENSVCDEYITEKFFDRVRFANVVPIVLSRKVLSRTSLSKGLPKKSIVAADDFRTVNEMAQFLRGLRNDYAEYRSYLEWRTHFRLSIETWRHSVRRAMCKLCIALHDTKLGRKQVANLDQWWKVKGRCKAEFVDRTLFH